jgi:geranylgeranyl pyrophosphate synthase
MARLVQSIRKTDAVVRAMSEARQHVNRALGTVERFDAGPEREALENLAKFIVDRKV